MSPTLEPGDLILASRFSHLVRSPRPGDLVLFRHPDPREGPGLVLKRVVAVPGDSVALTDDGLLVNGIPRLTPTGERYLPKGTYLRLTVPAGAYYVLGDNTRASADSRYWGALPEDSLRGLAAAILWPPGRIRPL